MPDAARAIRTAGTWQGMGDARHPKGRAYANINKWPGHRYGMAWMRVAGKGRIPGGDSREFDVGGKKITVVNQDGLYALDATCAHQEQSIACGKLEGDTIECPHHFWHYNYKTGKLLDYLKDVSLATYKVEEREDGIYVDA